jgi:hypothetical protein
MTSSAAPTGDKELVRSMQDLEKSLNRLPAQFEYLIHPGKHLFVAYLRGIFYGLGALTAFAVLIPIVVWTLRSVEWIPIIGEFISRVATQVEHIQPPR